MFENSNRRQFQKGLDCAAARADRRNATLSLRRKQREEHLQKKVRLLTNRLTANRGGENENNNGPPPSKDKIPKYVANIMNTDSDTIQFNGLRNIRKLLSVERDPPTKRIIAYGMIPKIIQFMYGNNYNLAFESAWAITNIAAATSDCTKVVVDHGAIAAFVHILQHNNFNGDNELIIQSIWGLGNISGDNRDYNGMILESGICNNIINLIDNNNSNIALQQNGIWAISNFVRNSFDISLRDLDSKFCNILSIICKLLSTCKDDDVIADCLWTLNYLSNQNDFMMEYIVNNCDCIDLCMKILSNEYGKYEIALSQSQKTNQQTTIAGNNITNNNNNNSNSIKQAILALNGKLYRPCLRFIGSILTGNDSITQRVLDCGYLDCIEPFIHHFISSYRRETMWSLSNIFAGNHQQIEYILSREKLMKLIINRACHDVLAVRIEAIMCICNAVAEAIPSQRKRLADYGSIEALCQLLNPINNICDDKILLIIEGLEEFLKTFGNNITHTTNPFACKIEECQGLDFLETRSSDDNLTEDTWQAIINLMKTYWGEGITAVEEAACTTTIDTKTNQFHFGMNNNDNSMRFNF